MGNVIAAITQQSNKSSQVKEKEKVKDIHMSTNKFVVKAISELSVVSSDGSIDIDATVSEFRAALVGFLEADSSKYEKVSGLVAQVLTANKGVSTNMDFVAGSVARMLNAQAEDWSKTKKLVCDYIRDNACGEKDGLPVDSKTGALLPEPKLFFTGRGVGAGVMFFADRLANKA